MKQICLGSMITLIYQSRAKSGMTCKVICRGIFSAYDLNIDHFDKSLPGHLRNGHDPTPQALIDVAVEKDIEEINRGFKEHVMPMLGDDKRKALVRAIRGILREDTVDDNTVLGKSDGYTKRKLLQSNSYDESALLANLVTYAILRVDNKACKESIKEIPKGYVDSLINSDEKIEFLPELDDIEVEVPLNRTLKDPRFDRIFNKSVDTVVMGLNNPSHVCMYYLETRNCKFRFAQLKDFIIDNIGEYVFSRAKIKQITDISKKQSSVGAKAMMKFIHRYGTAAGSVLGEILLYIFLEQELNAPKIMSKIEISDKNNGSVSKSDGVHLLCGEQWGQPFHQLVFGASDIVGDLEAAVDRAFEKILAIEEDSDSEYEMLESKLQQISYEPDVVQYMVKLLKPQKKGAQKPEMAFGVFLGYTLQLQNPETNNLKFQGALKQQLDMDIASVQPHITDLIVSNNLEGYSFYFYILPFNDAEDEKKSIIEEMLSGGA